jgi:hypothetical protein
MELAVPSVASNQAPDAVYSALNAAHDAAGYMPLRSATVGNNAVVSSTADTGGPLAVHISKAQSEGGASRRDHSACSEMGERQRGFRR